MSEKTCYSVMKSPIGDLVLISNGEALTGLVMNMHKDEVAGSQDWKRDDRLLAPVRKQLEEYFAGERMEFDVPLEVEGTEFQKRAWAELRRIPYGETISYSEQARRMGKPAAVRAVGSANGRNMISIIIPCHRVIGADGSLAGFGGGIERKRALLELEARVLERAARLENARPCAV
jgi:methylated-DNA-[protein]-cysteine S-methyltransferase